jgi:hypothetical protein
MSRLLKLNSKLLSFMITDCILGPGEVPAIFQGLKFNTSIKFVDLGGGVTHVACPFIADMLKVNSKLQHFVLEYNATEDTIILMICEGLKYNQNLHKLNVRSNHIASEGC